MMQSKGLGLLNVVRLLNIYCLPHLADKWDNCGLLVEPSSPQEVKTIFITNDLTEITLNEAIHNNANLIISYHPPIFTPIKKLTQQYWKERIIIRCIENRIGLFSPHTGLDAKIGGVNDWLLNPFDISNKLCLTSVPTNIKDNLVKLHICINENFGPFVLNSKLLITDITNVNASEAQITCLEKNLHSLLKCASELNIRIFSETLIEGTNNEGYGRIANLVTPETISEVINKYKNLFNLNNVLVALGNGKNLDDMVRTIAVCAGSGGSILCRTPLALTADLFVTGELSHHDRLEATSRGISVILAGHSVTERGYFRDCFIPEFSQLLKSTTQSSDPHSHVKIILSELDQEPGQIV